jgi:hypothetical protein
VPGVDEKHLEAPLFEDLVEGNPVTHGYQERFGHGSSRLRRIGIVALGRKLLIALWQYLETGVVPEGARLKPALRVR